MQQEEQQGALYVRASDGRCLSVFYHGQGPFTVLKVMVRLCCLTLSLTNRQMRQEIAKEDGIEGVSLV